MKKIFKIFLILLGLAFLIFCFYIYELRSLALEGNRIFELRCTTVNPPLIAYKNSFLKQADFLNNPEKFDEEDFIVASLDYISNMRKYVEQENKWLEIQRNYGNRWDFKLIEPWYMKQAWYYQTEMYEAYRDDAQGILDIGDGKIPVDKVSFDHSENREKLDYAKQRYFDFFDQAVEISDWRKIFSALPAPEGCTEENMTIPQTSGSINWEGTPTPQPKIPPGLENSSG